MHYFVRQDPGAFVAIEYIPHVFRKVDIAARYGECVQFLAFIEQSEVILYLRSLHALGDPLAEFFHLLGGLLVGGQRNLLLNLGVDPHSQIDLLLQGDRPGRGNRRARQKRRANHRQNEATWCAMLHKHCIPQLIKVGICGLFLPL